MAIVERTDRGALGVTVDGIPIQLVVPFPDAGNELLRATGSKAYVDPTRAPSRAPDEAGVYPTPWLPSPPELREEPFSGEPPALLELSDIRGDLHCHTTWSDGRASVLEMERPRGSGLRLSRHLRPHARRSGRSGPGRRCDPPPGRGDRGRERGARPLPRPPRRGVRHPPDGSLDLPDDVLAELEWVMASLHAGQRRPRRELTRAGGRGGSEPLHLGAQPPYGPSDQPPASNALDLDEVFAAAVETGTALEVNGLPDRLDLNGENVRRRSPRASDRGVDRRALGRRAREHGARSRPGAAAARLQPTWSTRERSRS